MFPSLLARVDSIRVIEVKLVRHVRTPEGERRYGQPIGSVIVRDRRLAHLESLPPKYAGWERVKGSDGNIYSIGKSDAGNWVATEGDDGWSIVASGKSEDAVYTVLDQHVGGMAPKPPAKPAAPRVRASRAATKPNGAIPRQPKAKAVPLWQKPWADLTDDEKQSLIEKRGQLPATVLSHGGRIPLTDALMKAKRKAELKGNDKTLADVVKRHQKNGWRLLNDEERHNASMKIGKPIPPAWSHVFAREGTNNLTGIAWNWKVQTIQPAEGRAASLGQKFDRYRKFAKRVPTVERAVLRDMQKGNATATVVGLMFATGARVDSSGGKNATGSRGLTTLQSRDVRIRGNRVQVEFPGKSNHVNTYQFVDKQMAETLAKLKDGKKPSEQLFPEVDDKDTLAYIKKVTGDSSFINHDVRTFVANQTAYTALKNWEKAGHEYPDFTNQKAVAKFVKEIAKVVGDAINDTPTTAYNSYIDPLVFTSVGIPDDMLPNRGAK